MANSFGSLYIGSSGLQGAQNALNTTANNLANVNTVGYVRQQVRFTDKRYDALRLPQPTINMQQSGLGVSIGDVAHARDIFLDKTYRTESARASFYTECFETVSYVEELFQELDGEEFKESVTDLWVAFQELAKAPADSVNQNLVVQKAELLISRTQTLYSDLQSYQSNINLQIKEDIERMNEIGKRIYELNLEIQKVEAGKVETAMTVRDERDALLDELATYANIEVTEDYSGFAFVQMEGVNFVDENCCYEIGLHAAKGTNFYTPYWPQLSNVANDEYVAVFRLDGEISTEENNDLGGVKAKLFMRGNGYGRHTDMETAAAYDKIQDCTTMESEAMLDSLFHNIVTAMNDIFCPNTTAQADITDAAGNVVIAAGTKILDTANCAVGVDGELPPQELFVRVGTERYTKVTVDGTDYYVYNEEDPVDSSKAYQIGSIEINANLQQQATLLPAFTQNGAVDYALGTKLATAWGTKSMRLSPYDTNPCTFEGFYDKIIAKLGTDGTTYRTASETMDNTVASIDSSRQQIMGVSSDEELTKMIKYQSAYNAASRYINVISQMTELIVTGLI